MNFAQLKQKLDSLLRWLSKLVKLDKDKINDYGIFENVDDDADDFPFINNKDKFKCKDKIND